MNAFPRRSVSWFGRLLRVAAVLLTGLAAQAAAVLNVCTSTPDLESLAKEVGGARVRVVCFSSGPEDPHEIELKPSFSRELEKADLYLQVGLGLENAWLERLMQTVKNAGVKPGQPGNLNLSQGVRLLEGEEGRPQPGSFHEEGNPHYLLDPLEGLKAARAIRDRLATLRPEWREEFGRNHAALALRLGTLMVGAACAASDDVEKLLLEWEGLKTPAETKAFQERHALGGWMAALAAYRGKAFVGDHDLWPYFARRTGLTVLGYLEPSPGVSPTTPHLQGLIGRMKESKTTLVLMAPYFDGRHAEFVAKRTGARVVGMAHQTGGRPGTASYVDMVTFNMGNLLKGLQEGGR
ncbi:MAG: zinc ABC transporter substrate-binding protein [Verrucomicrobiales bacterium]|nr:zinc ABC transporter substrate-binding protein [Verrucomicrobiales bacterium]